MHGQGEGCGTGGGTCAGRGWVGGGARPAWAPLHVACKECQPHPHEHHHHPYPHPPTLTPISCLSRQAPHPPAPRPIPQGCSTHHHASLGPAHRVGVHPNSSRATTPRTPAPHPPSSCPPRPSAHPLPPPASPPPFRYYTTALSAATSTSPPRQSCPPPPGTWSAACYTCPPTSV